MITAPAVYRKYIHTCTMYIHACTTSVHVLKLLCRPHMCVRSVRVRTCMCVRAYVCACVCPCARESAPTCNEPAQCSAVGHSIRQRALAFSFSQIRASELAGAGWVPAALALAPVSSKQCSAVRKCACNRSLWRGGQSTATSLRCGSSEDRDPRQLV